MFNGKQPNSFEDMFQLLPGINRTKCFKLEILKSKPMEYFPAATLPRTWNSLNQELKDVVSIKGFKNQLSQSLISSYQSTVRCYELITIVQTSK